MIMIIKIITINRNINKSTSRAVFFSLAFGLAELFEKAMERGRERERERIWIPKFQTIGLLWFNPWFTPCLTHVNICHVNPWLAAFPKWSWPRCFLPVGRSVAQSRRLDPCSGRRHAWGTGGAGTGPNGISAVGQWMIWMEPGFQTGCSYSMFFLWFNFVFFFWFCWDGMQIHGAQLGCIMWSLIIYAGVPWCLLDCQLVQTLTLVIYRCGDIDARDSSSTAARKGFHLFLLHRFMRL